MEALSILELPKKMKMKMLEAELWCHLLVAAFGERNLNREILQSSVLIVFPYSLPFQ